MMADEAMGAETSIDRVSGAARESQP